jgi:hypothetical protein
MKTPPLKQIEATSARANLRSNMSASPLKFYVAPRRRTRLGRQSGHGLSASRCWAEGLLLSRLTIGVHSHRRKLKGADNQLDRVAIAGGLTLETQEVDVNRHGLLGNVGRRIGRLIKPTGERVAYDLVVSLLGLKEHIREAPSEAVRTRIAV